MSLVLNAREHSGSGQTRTGFAPVPMGMWAVSPWGAPQVVRLSSCSSPCPMHAHGSAGHTSQAPSHPPGPGVPFTPCPYKAGVLSFPDWSYSGVGTGGSSPQLAFTFTAIFLTEVKPLLCFSVTQIPSSVKDLLGLLPVFLPVFSSLMCSVYVSSVACLGSSVIL